MSYFVFYAAALIATIFVFVPHEYAHGWVAYKNGDPTAKMNGRLTLNPLKHLDLTGLIMMWMVGFGWAKPVPINPYNFRNYRVGLFTTAIAGITVNYIIAFLVYPLYLLVVRYMPDAGVASSFLQLLFDLIFTYSLCSVVFNLLPFNPLDGFRVVEALTRQVNSVQRFLRNYGQMILVILIVESFLCGILTDLGIGWAQNYNILHYVMTFATDIIGLPIKAMWNAVFGLPWNWNIILF